jgi:hypothetical protein
VQAEPRRFGPRAAVESNHCAEANMWGPMVVTKEKQNV